jgi:hypothetical protein
MAGLVPAIHVFDVTRKKQDVGARHKLALGPAGGRTRVAGHDAPFRPRPNPVHAEKAGKTSRKCDFALE